MVMKFILMEVCMKKRQMRANQILFDLILAGVIAVHVGVFLTTLL